MPLPIYFYLLSFLIEYFVRFLYLMVKLYHFISNICVPVKAFTVLVTKNMLIFTFLGRV